MRAFVHDVSPGLVNPARRLVHVIFHSAHHCALTTWRYLAPAAPDGSLYTGNPDSTSTTAPHARLLRLRLHHPTLSASSTSAQRAITSLELLIRFLYSPSMCVIDPIHDVPAPTAGGCQPTGFYFGFSPV
jgi:hypothetical protein